MSATILTGLGDICKQYPFQNKLLLCPSRLWGYALLNSLSAQGISWLNVRPVTLMEIAEALIGQQQETLDHTGVQAIVADLIREQKIAGGGYFSSATEVYRLVPLIARFIMDCRLADIHTEDLEDEQFVDYDRDNGYSRKAQELRWILAEYEDRLIKETLLDQASVLKKASEIRQNMQLGVFDTMYILPDSLEFTPLEQQFVTELAGDRIHYLSTHSQQLLSKNIKLFRAYGQRNEVHEVFRYITEKKIAVDQVLISCSDTAYIPYIYSLAERLKIGITSSTGIPITTTFAGRMVLGIIAWIESGFQRKHLYYLLKDSLIKLTKGQWIAQMLRRKQIGPGLQQFSEWAEQQRSELEKSIAEQTEKSTSMAERYEGITAFCGFLTEVNLHLARLISGNNVNYATLVKGLADIIEQYSRIWYVQEDGSFSTRAAAGRKLVIDRLTEASQVNLGDIPIAEAVRLLRCLVETISQEASNQEPGCLHVTDLLNGEPVFRPYTFFLGLDSSRFPGQVSQDPILLDWERQRINQNKNREVLRLAGSELLRKTTMLNRILASRNSKVIIGYSCLDTLEDRPLLPTPLVLELYRIKSGRSEADYTNLEEDKTHISTASYFSNEEERCLDNSEWWLCRNHQEFGNLALRQRVLNAYPFLAAGENAEQCRLSSEFTEYDGKVSVEADVWPGFRDQTIAPSHLEKLGQCPFSYLLSRVLGIHPAESLVTSDEWLNAAEQGTLFHYVLLRYHLEVYRDKLPANLTRLQDHVRKVLAEERRHRPPVSEAHFQWIQKTMLDVAVNYLSILEQQESCQVVPVYFEFPIGGTAEEVNLLGYGTTEPVVLVLPSGDTWKLRGKVDRIDNRGNEYHVWDFKLGKSDKYAAGYFSSGQVLQHALYALMVESVLRKQNHKDIKVTDSGYIFPKYSSAHQIITKPAAGRDKALQLLDLMNMIIKLGKFNLSDAKECNAYCDYLSVCRRAKIGDSLSNKSTSLPEWNELRTNYN